jgi:FKBP-type peptidyl-prolyl cis-trans isomerase
MMKTTTALFFTAAAILCDGANGFTLSMSTGSLDTASSRRAFISSSTAALGAIGIAQSPANAAATKEILNLPSGIKYAVLKESSASKLITPLKGDIVAVEYTGYLANGQIFDVSYL